MKTREEYGTPYSVNEARLYLASCGHEIDQYPRELMAFLVSEVERLEILCADKADEIEAIDCQAERLKALVQPEFTATKE